MLPKSPLFSSLKGLQAIILLLSLSLCSSQNFHPDVNDKEYLDTIETRLKEESMVAHNVLVNQTKILQQVTRSFIESKIKENLFKAVRERVEMELEEMAKNNATTRKPSNSSRQARQDDDDDEEVRPTIPPRPGLLPQLANVVTTLFGSDVNVTGYVQDATSFLPQDLSSRIISAASLIDPNRFTSTTLPPPLVINGQVIPQSALINGTTYTFSQVGPDGQTTTTIVQQRPQNIAAAVPIPQSSDVNGVTNNNVPLQPVNILNPSVPEPLNSQKSKEPDVSTFVPQPIVVGVRQQQEQPINEVSPQQNLNKNGGIRHNLLAPLPLAQPGTVQQYNVVGPIGVPIQPSQLLSTPVLNFKVNEALLPSSQGSATSPATSNEEEEYENNSSEKTTPEDSKTPQNEEDSAEKTVRTGRADWKTSSEVVDDLPLPVNELIIRTDDPSGDDIPILRDDAPLQGDDPADPATQNNLGYLDEYPAVKYAIRIFNHFTTRSKVPTTTEFVPTTMRNSSLLLDYEDELDIQETVTGPSTYKQVVQGGIALWEGAREAYNLLQQVNSYFDKINTRLENAGYGAEDVGIDLK